MAAPQQLDSNGLIKGHPFIVFEQLTSPDQLDPTDPIKFLLFKGITGASDSTGVVTTSVTGLPAGFYRLSSIVAATNGQPVLLPVLQHGAVDDSIYITVTVGGALPTNHTSLSSSSSRSSATPSPSSTGSVNGDGTGTSTVAPPKNHVAAAVGGALAGISVIILMFAIWFFIRRRNQARKRMLIGHPVVLSSEDFGSDRGTDSSMAQIITPFPAHTSKRSRGPVVPRRFSAASAAPSYHTRVNVK